MALLTRDERRNLIDLLMNLPGIDDQDARSLLLADLPRSLRESVDPSDPARVFLGTLVNNIEGETWAPPIEGSWPLATLLENAIDMAADTTVGRQVRDVLNTVRARIAQGTYLPAAPPTPPPTPPAPGDSPAAPATRPASGGGPGVRTYLIAGGLALAVLVIGLAATMLLSKGRGGGEGTPTATVAVPTLTSEPQVPTGRIAFTSRRYNGKDDILVANADGSQPIPTRLTDDPEHDYGPTWSPDGQQIAFASYRNGRHGIYVMNADGSQVQLLRTLSGDETSLAWSPDGQYIAFAAKLTGNYDIYRMPAAGGEPLNLTNHPADDTDPTWAPDSTQLAFVSKRDGNDEIYTMTVGGHEVTNRTHNAAADEFLPAWSPDGQQIAYTLRQHIGGPSDIYVMQAGGANPHNLTNHPADDFGVTWSPDGRFLAFASERDGGNPEIYIMHADGTAPVNLTHDPAWDFQPAWWGPK